jgi:hypothetical protein
MIAMQLLKQSVIGALKTCEYYQKNYSNLWKNALFVNKLENSEMRGRK